MLKLKQRDPVFHSRCYRRRSRDPEPSCRKIRKRRPVKGREGPISVSTQIPSHPMPPVLTNRAFQHLKTACLYGSPIC